MAYIGVQPRLGNFQACDAITTSATTTFNLLVGGTAIFPQSAQHCLVSLNGVLQAPISSYTISGSTIVFASALTSADSIDFITILGDTLDLGVPSDDTVGAAQIKADLISGTTALTSAPAATDEFLVSDAGVLKRVDASLVGRGRVLQVVQDTKLDRSEISVSSAGTFVDISGLSVAITPSATSSKILILAFVNGSQNVGSAGGFFTLKRDSTEIFRGDAASSRQRATGNLASYSNAYINGNTPVFLDSPSSTSELTYKVSVCSDGSNTTVYINRGSSNTDNASYIAGASSIIAMEIA